MLVVHSKTVPLALGRYGRPAVSRVPTFGRCFAKRPDREEKSWSEIAEEAAEVARCCTASQCTAMREAVKRRERASERKKRSNEGIIRPGDFFGGFMVKTMGSFIDTFFKGISEQMAQSQKQTSGIYQEATQRVQQSRQIRSALGDVSCGPLLSQSTSSQTINGVTTKRTVLEFPVSGQTGEARVRVDAKEDASQKQNIQINVQLGSGKVIRVDGEEGGRTIDVDWKDI